MDNNEKDNEKDWAGRPLSKKGQLGQQRVRDFIKSSREEIDIVVEAHPIMAPFASLLKKCEDVEIEALLEIFARYLRMIGFEMVRTKDSGN